MNFLEQLTSEWLEHRGYFVRRHVQVESRRPGVLDCDLSIVAFHPETQHLLQVEPSMDTSTRRVRSQRYERIFAAGRTHIPTMFEALVPVRRVDQVALFGYGNRDTHATLAGGRVLFVDELVDEIRETLRARPALAGAVSERFVCLRTIQLTMQSEIRLRDGVERGQPLVPDARERD